MSKESKEKLGMNIESELCPGDCPPLYLHFNFLPLKYTVFLPTENPLQYSKPSLSVLSSRIIFGMIFIPHWSFSGVMIYGM